MSTPKSIYDKVVEIEQKLVNQKRGPYLARVGGADDMIQDTLGRIISEEPMGYPISGKGIEKKGKKMKKSDKKSEEIKEAVEEIKKEKKKRLSKKQALILGAAQELEKKELEDLAKMKLQDKKKYIKKKEGKGKYEKVEVFNEPYDSWKDILAKVTMYLKKRGDKAGLRDVIEYIKKYDLYKKKEK